MQPSQVDMGRDILRPRKASADPGYGDATAAIGTEEWAKHWRLQFQSVVQNLDTYPSTAKAYFDVGQEHRAWTMLTDAAGKRFASFEAFCECQQPYGLGRPYVEIKAYLLALVGERAFAVETVAPDGRANNRRGGKIAVFDSCDSRTNQKPALLRAINRAPEPIRELYEAGLIGQKEAAKLGPARPTPEQAAQIAAVTEVVRGTERPTTERERVKVQRVVNKRVRELLGHKETPLTKFERLARKVSLEDLAAAIPLLKSIHADRVAGGSKPRRRKP